MDAAVLRLLSGPWAQRVGWALVHSLWQGTAVALLLAAGLHVLRHRSPQLRWTASCVALLIMAAMPAVTAALVPVQAPAPGSAAVEPAHRSEASPGVLSEALLQTAGPLPAEPVPSAPAVSWHRRAAQMIEPALPWAVLAWMVGVLALTLWHLGGWWRLVLARRRGVRPAGEAVQELFASLRERLSVSRPVRLLESARVAVPVVAGWLRPVVLLPAGALTGLTPDQLVAVLAHELTHVRRHDALVRVFQAVVETLLFYHPAVWWVSGRLRQQSEECCDEVAVEVCGDRRGYAEALVQCASAGAERARMAVGAGGGSLLERVRRVVGLQPAPEALTSRWVAGVLAVCVAAALAVGAYVGGTPSDAGEGSAASEGPTASAPFQATLPNGVTVELLGVSYHPSEGKPWWRPDGSPLVQRPYDRWVSFGAVLGDEREREKAYTHSFALQIGGVETIAGRTVTYQVDPARFSKGTTALRKGSEDLQDIYGIAAAMDGGVKTAALKVGVAGDWTTRARTPGARRTGGWGSGGPVPPDGWADVQLLDGDEDTLVSVVSTFPAPDSRVVAVDLDGELHPATVRSVSSLVTERSGGLADSDLRHLTARFPGLRRERIAEARFETRSYRWVEFRNVSLKPGRETDVEVVVEPELDPAAEELRELVEDFFAHNWRDITARETLEWGEPELHENGNRSIRYKYRASIWGRDQILQNKVFTFGPEGEFLSVEDVKEPLEGTREELQTLVMEFFKHNWKDITRRETIAWGDVQRTPEGDFSIRYRFEATIHGKDKKVLDKVFTFGPDGEFVKAEDAAGADSAGAAGPTFGPVVEQTVRQRRFVDFDSGAILDKPLDVPGGELERMLTWARQSGADAFPAPMDDGEHRGIIGYEMASTLLRADQWSGLSAQQVVEMARHLETGTPAAMWELGEPPETCLIRTREGGMGILQIVGFTDDPEGVKIRYKMLESPDRTPILDKLPLLKRLFDSDGTGRIVRLAPEEEPAETEPPVRAQDVEFPDAPPTRVFDVRANLPGVEFSTWQNSRVLLLPGDVLYIEADGVVNYTTRSTQGPDGRGNTWHAALLPEVSFVALVGRTHLALLDDGVDSSGKGIYGPGFVGSAFKMEVGQRNEGWLYLAVNESCDEDNSGAFTARIWVVRDGEVLPPPEPAKESAEPEQETAAPQREARKSMLSQRLHSLGLAINTYRMDHEGQYPPDLETLEREDYLTEECPLASFSPFGREVQYVVPDTDEPDEVVLYHWPPFAGGAWLLYPDLSLEWAEVQDGCLVNPRTGGLIRKALSERSADAVEALHEAAGAGDTAAIERLLGQGADVNALNAAGQTPLHVAAERGHVEVCRVLLDAEADIEARESRQFTPLGVAAFARQPATVQLLLERGAEVDAKNVWIWTPLHAAAQVRATDVARILHQYGADPTVESNIGQTPLDIAAGHGLTEIVKLLAPDTPETREAERKWGPIGMALVLKGFTELRPLEVHVLSDRSGDPIAGAAVNFRLGPVKPEKRTDEHGVCRIPVPTEELDLVQVIASSEGMVSRRLRWERVEGSSLPRQVTLRLKPGVAIGGIVQNEQGKPVERARVNVHFSSEGPGPQDYFRKEGLNADEQGRWRANGAPAEAAELSIHVSHPDYPELPYYLFVDADELRDMEHVTVLERGYTLTGRVTDAAGKPIPIARVMLAEDRFGSPKEPSTETDRQGRFRFDVVSPTMQFVTVQAEGYAPDMQNVKVSAETAPLTFRLEQGHSIRGRVVGPDGRPVEGAGVVADTWRRYRPRLWSGRTGEEGRFEWTSAPADAVMFGVYKKGYMSKRDLSLTAREEEYVIEMHGELEVSGTVTDARTGEPISEFTVIPGIQWDAERPTFWDQEAATAGANGQYTLRFTYPRFGHAVRIEAPGYKPALSRVFKDDEGELVCDFELETGANVEGVVLRPDGEPAVGARCALVRTGHWIQVENAEIGYHEGSPVVETDAGGRFSFPPQTEEFIIVVLHESGYGQVHSDELPAEGTVSLEPWSRVQGRAMRGDGPFPECEVHLFEHTIQPRRPGAPQVSFSHSTHADAEGRFAFEQVRPGEAGVALAIEISRTRTAYSHHELAFMEPGETATVTLGGGGRPVVGKLMLPEEANFDFSEVDFRGNLSRDRPSLPLPEGYKDWAQERRHQWYAEWQHTEEGRAYRQQHHGLYHVEVQPDGSFRAEDVPPGDYRLRISLLEPPERGTCGPGDPLADVNVTVTVEQGDRPVDLGELEAVVRPRLEAGEKAPDFSFETLDGEQMKLSDFRGKYVLLDFWATWCGPCLGETPYLMEVWEEFGGRDDFAIISLSLDRDEDKPRAYAEENGMEWVQGFLGDWRATQVPDRFGVRGIPAIFLIGPEGAIVATKLRGSGIKQAVQQALFARSRPTG